MKIIYKVGDLLKAPERVICHGVNSRGVFRSGIAKQIREEIPEAYDSYKNAYDDAISRKQEGLELGLAIWVVADQARIVINAVTQKDYGYDADKGAVYLSYDALRKAIQKINVTAKTSQEENSVNFFGRIDTVAFPLIGCGLAGGKWPLVAEIIEEESTDFQPVVYTQKDFIPTV